MTATGRKFALTVLIGLLALPSGLCSAFFTISGAAMLFDTDALTRSASVVMLFCVLVLLGARRLSRSPIDPIDPASPTGPHRP
jgi:ethanolamine transporter EutH